MDELSALSAAAALRRARRQAALSQSELARLAATSQSAVAAYESGARQPTVPTLRRMIEATGNRLHLSITQDPGVWRLVDLADHLRAAPDDTTRLRLVFEFLRAAQESEARLPLVSREPEPIGDQRFDALLAAIAEDLTCRDGHRPPDWVHDDTRFLDHSWWVSDLPSARAQALVHTPASYRRRGLWIDRRDLVAA